MADRCPILWLTLQQFASGRAIRLVGLFALTPIVFALIYLANPGDAGTTSFLTSTFTNLLAPTVIPLATLILATGALGNEISDRTLVYLYLKPVRRGRIIAAKLGGAMLPLLTIFGVAVTGMWAIVAVTESVSGRALAALLLATGIGALAYGALFLLVSLLVSRALVVGVIYILLWESLLTQFIPGIRLLSIRHYTVSIMAGVLNESATAVANASGVTTSLIVLGVVVVFALSLASRRLATMDLE